MFRCAGKRKTTIILNDFHGKIDKLIRGFVLGPLQKKENFFVCALH